MLVVTDELIRTTNYTPAELECVSAAIIEAEGRYVINGTSEREHGGPPYKIDGPWYLIDQQNADPEINWPGDFVAEFASHREAHNGRMRIVARAAIVALRSTV